MYRNQNQFTMAYGEARSYYEKLSNRLDWLAPIDMARGWDIYQQARDAEYGVLVMGRTVVDEPTRTPQQFGNAITLQDHQGLGVITHRSEAGMVNLQHPGAPHTTRTTGGMIMHFYADLAATDARSGPGADWRRGRSGYHFFYNDCWLLGGAHAKHDFNLASPRRRDNIWGRYGLTATGRELAFLFSHGYSFVKVGHQKLEVATCRRDRMAEAASFGSLVRAVSGYSDVGDTYRLVDLSQVGA